MVYQATRINTPRNSEPQSFLISDAGRLWTSPFSDRPWAMYFKVLRTFFPENVLGSSSVIWGKKIKQTINLHTSSHLMLWEEVGGILSMLKLSYKNETTACNSDLLNEVPHMYVLHYNTMIIYNRLPVYCI